MITLTKSCHFGIMIQNERGVVHMGAIPVLIVGIITCCGLVSLNTFLKPIESVYAKNKGGLRALNAVCRLFGCVLLFGSINFALGRGCLVVMNSEDSSAAAVLFIFLLVTFILAGLLVFISVKIRDKLNSHAYDYMLPDESSQLKDMNVNEVLLYKEGEDEALSKINQYCRKTIEIATGFANNYTPGPVDCVNKNNYCACDILMFAAQIGQDRIAKSKSENAGLLAKNYFLKMKQEISFLCGANATQLDNYLLSRKFLRDTPEHTVEALVHVLTYDSVDLENKNLCGWEVPDDSEAISSFDFDQNIWNHIIETADSLYDTIEKGFDEVFLKL